ncbi:hypothetical protein VULLAG_LOCUS1914 [Vulpes lagopus]
MENLTEESDSS